jgi:hypothetical protein
MSRTALYALILFISTAFWGFFTPLIYLITGHKIILEAKTNEETWIRIGMVIVLAASGFLLSQKPQKDVYLSDQENRIAACIAILFLFLAFNLQCFLARILHAPDYETFLRPLIWIYIIEIAIFFLILVLAPRKGDWALAATAAFIFFASFFWAGIFPAEYGHSDILLSIKAANHSLLAGRSPYEIQTIYCSNIRCSYLPGLWLLFLPAEYFQFNPNILSSFFTLIFIGLMWQVGKGHGRPYAYWLSTLIVLDPWWILRQDSYISVYLALWALFALCLLKEKPFLAALCFGFGLAMHPFSWALLPVWLAWVLKRYELRQTLFFLGSAMAVATLFLLPFFAIDPNGFVQANITHWSGEAAFSSTGFSLISWFRPPAILLTALSVFFIGLGAWLTYRRKAAIDSLYYGMAFSLGLALLSSYHIEHYYYLVPILFLIFREIILTAPVEQPNLN